MRIHSLLAAAAAALTLFGCTQPPVQNTGTPAGATAVAAGPSVSTATPVPTPAGPVAVGVPTRLRIPEAGFDSATRTMSIAGTGAIDPPGFRDVYWISDRGSAPGTDAADTTYFSCHTDQKASAAAVPCNALPGSVRAGQHVVVSNPSGDITYTVTSARTVRRSDFATDRAWDVAPGRLVLVTCYLENGRRTDFNLVIEADVVRT